MIAACRTCCCSTSTTTTTSFGAPTTLSLSRSAAFLSLSFNLLRSKSIAVSSTPSVRCRSHFSNDSGNGGGGDTDTEVNCEVHVVSWRERRVKASISIDADIESVWKSLTDYEHLADFIPNLVWRSSTTNLSYEVNVIPRLNFPAILLERIIRSDLPVNLRALACRVENNIMGNQKLSIADNHLDKTPGAINGSSVKKINGALSESDKLLSEDNKEGLASSISGPIPASSGEANSKWGVFGRACRLDRPCVVDEIHLRRFDGLLENGGVHRGVVASITVKAPVCEVWNVLSSYERLPEIVPNLAISKILSRDNNKVRILQEGCKGLLYMVLHARVVLDLCEYLEQEITFEQVEGDFDSFQGKWIFEQLGNHHTLLKYSVESKMRKDTFLSESIMEEVIYEDLPSNLCAIRDYVENRTASHSLEVCEDITETGQEIVTSASGGDDGCSSADDLSNSNAQSSSRQKPRVPGLQRDIEVLKSELLKFIAEYGQEGFMPMRKQLRLHGRVDIEKAITRMGGFRKIASTMNLSLAYKHRKPKGYWDDLENLKNEISRFQRSWGMDPSFMPSRKSFERAEFLAGRFDIARALEKWGGLHEVSRLLSLKVRRKRRRQGNLAKDKKIDPVTATHEHDVGSETKTPRQMWLAGLKQIDEDINWVG
ncbi:uncharacterized protein [Arachis hypogaea]|uniref:uncharacterized protein isoform X3 n=1 Tax=Arachis hypogaea TaxID=3818 RepID=UPI003B213B4B